MKDQAFWGFSVMSDNHTYQLTLHQELHYSLS